MDHEKAPPQKSLALRPRVGASTIPPACREKPEALFQERNQVMKLFRDLSPAEETEFRQWARDNYKPTHTIEGVWHPVVQDECRKMNEEADLQPGLTSLLNRG
jgi:hypothetical protein